MLGGRPVFVQYSQHKELKTDAAHAIANEKAQVGLQWIVSTFADSTGQ